jgi:hypothetical protein
MLAKILFICLAWLTLSLIVGPLVGTIAGLNGLEEEEVLVPALGREKLGMQNHSCPN